MSKSNTASQNIIEEYVPEPVKKYVPTPIAELLAVGPRPITIESYRAGQRKRTIEKPITPKKKQSEEVKSGS